MNNDLQGILHRIDVFIVMNHQTLAQFERYQREHQPPVYYFNPAINSLCVAHGFEMGGSYAEPFGFDLYDKDDPHIKNGDDPLTMFRLAVIDGRIHVQQYVRDEYGSLNSDF